MGRLRGETGKGKKRGRGENLYFVDRLGFILLTSLHAVSGDLKDAFLCDPHEDLEEGYFCKILALASHSVLS